MECLLQTLMGFQHSGRIPLGSVCFRVGSSYEQEFCVLMKMERQFLMQILDMEELLALGDSRPAWKLLFPPTANPAQPVFVESSHVYSPGPCCLHCAKLACSQEMFSVALSIDRTKLRPLNLES